jgi:hypothetical protein
LSGGERSARRRFSFNKQPGSELGETLSLPTRYVLARKFPAKTFNALKKVFGIFVPNFRDWDSEQQKLQIKNQTNKK